MSFNLVDFVKEHRGLVAIGVAILARIATHYGVELDADGITNDLVSFAALAVTAQQHVHLKATVAANVEAVADAKAARVPGSP